MAKFLLLFPFFLPFVMVQAEDLRGSVKPQNSNVKLFVFGDSYVDTGNTPKASSDYWRQPYGITCPGKPVGRPSDGRILTDYIAQFLNIASPVPYEQRQSQGIQNGMNFAYSGTGVFNTRVPLPNMTIQINNFQQLLEEKVFTKIDLDSSVALISPAGNDYAAYLLNQTSITGLPGFASRLINLLSLNLQRIHDLGVRKIGVLTLPPWGCVPYFTAPSFQQCNKGVDVVPRTHNPILQQAMNKLRNENKGSVFVTLDIYSAFTSALAGNSLRPCCEGIGKGNNCASVDAKGAKLYTVCNDPNSPFFWDVAHPSQHGWAAVYTPLQSTLQQLR